MVVEPFLGFLITRKSRANMCPKARRVVHLPQMHQLMNN